MFTTETGIGVVVMVVLRHSGWLLCSGKTGDRPGKTARARASAKANGWEQDEMQEHDHT